MAGRSQGRGSLFPGKKGRGSFQRLQIPETHGSRASRCWIDEGENKETHLREETQGAFVRYDPFSLVEELDYNRSHVEIVALFRHFITIRAAWFEGATVLTDDEADVSRKEIGDVGSPFWEILFPVIYSDGFPVGIGTLDCR